MGSLTSVQHAVLVGSLLGDGTLRRQGTRTNALFEVNHSFRSQDYVNWKWKHFHEYVITPPKSRKGNGNRIAYRFTTRSLPIFTKYYCWFYKDGRKSIPLNLEINPIALAVWFMDDGARSRNSIYLNTQQFSLEEQEFLISLLYKTFQIECALNRDKSYYRLRVNTQSTRKMKQIMLPYVLECFKYKLMDDPVTTDPKGKSLLF